MKIRSEGTKSTRIQENRGVNFLFRQDEPFLSDWAGEESLDCSSECSPVFSVFSVFSVLNLPTKLWAPVTTFTTAASISSRNINIAIQGFAVIQKYHKLPQIPSNVNVTLGGLDYQTFFCFHRVKYLSRYTLRLRKFCDSTKILL